MHACVNGFVFHLRKWPFPISYSSHMESIESYMYTCHTHGLLESFLSKNFTLIPIYKSKCLQIHLLKMYSFFSFHLGIYLHFAYSIACMHECTHAHKHLYTDFLALLGHLMSSSLFPFLPCLPTFEPIRHVQPFDIVTQIS